jgi:ribosomal-protein-alanine N-acetyltransferase
LRGARVELCEPNWSDEAEFVGLRLASRDFLAPWEATLEGLDPFGPERFRRFMVRGPTRRRFLIRSRERGGLVGALSFSEVDRARRSATVGYWIGAEHARQGLMSEALALGLAWARSELALERIDAYVLPENNASIALLIRCGFALDALVPRYRVVAGRMRDHERWTLAFAPA